MRTVTIQFSVESDDTFYTFSDNQFGAAIAEYLASHSKNNESLASAIIEVIAEATGVDGDVTIIPIVTIGKGL